MALIKEKVTENGIQGNYWKITAISIDAVRYKIVCRIDLYVSAEFKDTTPIQNTNKTFLIPIDTKHLEVNIFQFCYSHIKNNLPADMEGAIDG